MNNESRYHCSEPGCNAILMPTREGPNGAYCPNGHGKLKDIPHKALNAYQKRLERAEWLASLPECINKNDGLTGVAKKLYVDDKLVIKASPSKIVKRKNWSGLVESYRWEGMHTTPQVGDREVGDNGCFAVRYREKPIFVSEVETK